MLLDILLSILCRAKPTHSTAYQSKAPPTDLDCSQANMDEIIVDHFRSEPLIRTIISALQECGPRGLSYESCEAPEELSHYLVAYVPEVMYAVQVGMVVEGIDEEQTLRHSVAVQVDVPWN